jgi:hypothetical protein
MAEITKAWTSGLADTESALAMKKQSATVPTTPSIQKPTADLPSQFKNGFGAPPLYNNTSLSVVPPPAMNYMEYTADAQPPNYYAVDTANGGIETNTPKPLWYKNTVFLQFLTCLGVFLTSFILLILLKPSFLYKKPENKLDNYEFQPSRAVWVSLAAGIVTAILLVIFGLVLKKKKQQ